MPKHNKSEAGEKEKESTLVPLCIHLIDFGRCVMESRLASCHFYKKKIISVQDKKDNQSDTYTDI